MKILREELRTTKRGPEAWFSGVVWMDDVVSVPTLKVTRVTFEPGARTAWHTHPRGQALVVQTGVCQVQTRGGEISEVASGDSVWIEPGEVHWHGAASERTMVHLAIQDVDEQGVDVVWMKHV